jgi:nucleoside-diphosphate-sugar epimerase
MPRVSFDNINNVFVTGATGFIGRHLVSALTEAGASVSVLARSPESGEDERIWPGRDVRFVRGDLLRHSSIPGTCEGVSTVFHLAGYAHAEDANDVRADETHWKVTVEGTRALLRESVRVGVKHFVYASTVKAMGEGGQACLDEESPLEPLSGYGVAKRVAEKLVLEAGREHAMHVSVLRFPLVYGRENKGNLLRMIAAIDRGHFLPLPTLTNRRSMVHVDDAVQALCVVAERPEANGQIYLVTDGQPYATSDIYDQICVALGKPAPRWRSPLWALHVGARVGDVIGKLRGRIFVFNSDVLAKLTESAWYSNDKIRRELGFEPHRTLADGLPEMVEEYQKNKGRDG